MANPFVFAVSHAFRGKLPKPPEKPNKSKPEPAGEQASLRQPYKSADATTPT